MSRERRHISGYLPGLKKSDVSRGIGKEGNMFPSGLFSGPESTNYLRKVGNVL